MHVCRNPMRIGMYTRNEVDRLFTQCVEANNANKKHTKWV